MSCLKDKLLLQLTLSEFHSLMKLVLFHFEITFLKIFILSRLWFKCRTVCVQETEQQRWGWLEGPRRWSERGWRRASLHSWKSGKVQGSEKRELEKTSPLWGKLTSFLLLHQNSCWSEKAGCGAHQARAFSRCSYLRPDLEVMYQWRCQTKNALKIKSLLLYYYFPTFSHLQIHI